MGFSNSDGPPNRDGFRLVVAQCFGQTKNSRSADSFHGEDRNLEELPDMYSGNFPRISNMTLSAEENDLTLCGLAQRVTPQYRQFAKSTRVRMEGGEPKPQAGSLMAERDTSVFD